MTAFVERDYLSDLGHVIWLIVQFLDHAIESRSYLLVLAVTPHMELSQSYLHGCFVRLHFANGVELLNASTRFDKPLNDLAFCDT